MKYLPMSILEYRFDELGNTKSIVVQFSSHSQREFFNGNVELTQEYVKTVNPNFDLDRMNKAQCDIAARRKLKAWIDVKPPEQLPEDDGEEAPPVE